MVGGIANELQKIFSAFSRGRVDLLNFGVLGPFSYVALGKPTKRPSLEILGDERWGSGIGGAHLRKFNLLWKTPNFQEVHSEARVTPPQRPLP